MIKTPGSPATPVTMRNLEKQNAAALNNLVVPNPKLKVNLVVGIDKQDKQKAHHPRYASGSHVNAYKDYIKVEQNHHDEMESPGQFTTQNLSPHMKN